MRGRSVLFPLYATIVAGTADFGLDRIGAPTLQEPNEPFTPLFGYRGTLGYEWFSIYFDFVFLVVLSLRGTCNSLVAGQGMRDSVGGSFCGLLAVL